MTHQKVLTSPVFSSKSTDYLHRKLRIHMQDYPSSLDLTWKTSYPLPKLTSQVTLIPLLKKYVCTVQNITFFRILFVESIVWLRIYIQTQFPLSCKRFKTNLPLQWITIFLSKLLTKKCINRFHKPHNKDLLFNLCGSCFKMELLLIRPKH